MTLLNPAPEEGPAPSTSESSDRNDPPTATTHEKHSTNEPAETGQSTASDDAKQATAVEGMDVDQPVIGDDDDVIITSSAAADDSTATPIEWSPPGTNPSHGEFLLLWINIACQS